MRWLMLSVSFAVWQIFTLLPQPQLLFLARSRARHFLASMTLQKGGVLHVGADWTAYKLRRHVLFVRFLS